jgi:hypothetical protein
MINECHQCGEWVVNGLGHNNEYGQFCQQDCFLDFADQHRLPVEAGCWLSGCWPWAPASVRVI